MGSPFGFRRTHPLDSLDRLPGFRLLLPMLPWWRRDYDINFDEFFDGLWCFSFGIAIEPIGVRGRGWFGCSIRFSCGWVPCRG